MCNGIRCLPARDVRPAVPSHKEQHSDQARGLQVVRQCAEQASMWVNAGKELLLVHSRCGGYFNGPVALHGFIRNWFRHMRVG